MPAKRAADKPTATKKGGETGNMLVSYSHLLGRQSPDLALLKFGRLVPDAKERANMLFVVDNLDKPISAFVFLAIVVKGQYEPGTPTRGDRCLLHWKLCAMTGDPSQQPSESEAPNQVPDGNCLTMEMRSEDEAAYPMYGAFFYFIRYALTIRLDFVLTRT